MSLVHYHEPQKFLQATNHLESDLNVLHLVMNSLTVYFIISWFLPAFGYGHIIRGSKSEGLVTQTCLFVTPRAVARQAPLSMEFSKQEYWSGLLLPSPGDLPDPGIKQGSPALQADSLLSWATREAPYMRKGNRKTKGKINCFKFSIEK